MSLQLHFYMDPLMLTNSLCLVSLPVPLCWSSAVFIFVSFLFSCLYSLAIMSDIYCRGELKHTTFLSVYDALCSYYLGFPSSFQHFSQIKRRYCSCVCTMKTKKKHTAYIRILFTLIRILIHYIPNIIK